MSFVTIILGIILTVLGVRKENKTLRNVGIVVAIIGCIASAVQPAFLGGLHSGLSDTLGK